MRLTIATENSLFCPNIPGHSTQLCWPDHYFSLVWRARDYHKGGFVLTESNHSRSAPEVWGCCWTESALISSWRGILYVRLEEQCLVTFEPKLRARAYYGPCPYRPSALNRIMQYTICVYICMMEAEPGGLSNLGNTCFLNAALQYILSSQSLLRFLLSGH